MAQFAAVILNGGQSARMGQKKSQLKIKEITFLQHTQRRIEQAGIDNILISGPDVGQIHDIYENVGPLSGVHSAMCALQTATFKHLLVVPVDMPAFNASDLVYLIQKCQQTATSVYYQDAIMPFVIYDFKRHLATLDTLLFKASAPRGPSFYAFLKQLSANALAPPDAQRLLNINTPYAFAEYQKLNGEINNG